MDKLPLEKFLKNIRLLKKSCLKLKNKQLFFSNLYFLRNFSKGSSSNEIHEKWKILDLYDFEDLRFLNFILPNSL